MTTDAPRQRSQILLAAYGRHHQNARNKAIHYICVPAIMFAAMGILVALNFGVTLFAIAAAILYYNRFGQKTALQMAAILIFILLVYTLIMPPQHILAVAIGILILACAGQFAGHIYEGSKPSFTEDVQASLVAPLYVLAALKEKLARNSSLDPL